MGICLSQPKEQPKEQPKPHQQPAQPAQPAQLEQPSTKDIAVNCPYTNSTNENTPFYTFEGCKKQVKVLNVVDGDTVDIAFHHEEMNRIFKYRVRLYGIDTPEKRPLKCNVNRDKEIAASKVSKNALITRLEENEYIVIALFYKADKYGRLLATIYDKNGEDINKWMVKSGYAYSYYGKTKVSFEDQI